MRRGCGQRQQLLQLRHVRLAGAVLAQPGHQHLNRRWRQAWQRRRHRCREGGEPRVVGQQRQLRQAPQQAGQLRGRQARQARQRRLQEQDGPLLLGPVGWLPANKRNISAYKHTHIQTDQQMGRQILAENTFKRLMNRLISNTAFKS